MNWLQRVRLWEISLAVLIGFLSYFIYTLTQESHVVTNNTVEVLNHADKSLTNLDSTISGIGTSVQSVTNGLVKNEDQLTIALNKINQPCIPVKGAILTLEDSKNCGILADASRTLQTLRGAVGTVEDAGINFDQHQGLLYNQESLLFTHADSVVSNFIPIQNKLDKAIFDADALFTNKDLMGTIQNFNIVSGNLGDMSTDANKKFHAFLYPTPCKGFRCHLAQDIQYIKLGSQFMEPAYWSYELFTAAH
jgi:hypothetical protein